MSPAGDRPVPVTLIVTTSTTGDPAKLVASLRRRLALFLGDEAHVELAATPNGTAA